MPESKTSPRRIAAVERHREALDLRRKGWTYAQIGDALGITAQGAHEAVKAELKRTVQEPADDVRRLEIERLDGMLKAMEGEVEAGDTNAVMVALKLAERRSRLLGLDAPTKLAAAVVEMPLQGAVKRAQEMLADPQLADALRALIPKPEEPASEDAE